MSSAVIYFAEGLEECEGLITVDLLRRAGVAVTIAAVGPDLTIESSHKIRITCDALAEEIDPLAFDAVLLPGGLGGVNHLKASETVRRACIAAVQEGKILAAICAAPSVLAAFGLLAGKKATVYPSPDLIEAVKAGGAAYTAQRVTVDGTLITGEALGSAIPFALTLAEVLAGREKANKVKNAIVYKES